jgi:DNA-directed RNA polymerase specialized sigma24 family protein
MRLTWKQVHVDLSDSLQSPAAQQQFLAVQRGAPALAPYASPTALVSHLTSLQGSAEEKNALLAALVRAAQQRSDRGLGQQLLLLGLWPGLCGIHRRRRRHFDDAADFVSAVCDAFFSLVHAVDLGRVHRVAATLVRSTERALMEELRRSWARVSLTAPLELEPCEEPAAAPSVTAADLEGAHALLSAAAGSDADLLFRVLVLGEEQAEAACALALTATTARKRFSRALPKARVRVRRMLSHGAAPVRVSQATQR